MSASTLGEIMLTPAVEWEKFAKEWVALGGEDNKKGGGEVDDLAVAMGNWGKRDDGNDDMLE